MSDPEDHTPGRPDAAVFAALREVQSLVSAVERYTESARREHHLGRSDVQALNAIVEAEHVGSRLTPGRMSERLGFSSAATSSLIDRLVAADHVHREPDPDDGRRTVIVATPSAQRTGLQMMRPLIDRMTEVVASLPDGQRQVFAEVMARLVAASVQAQRDLEATD